MSAAAKPGFWEFFAGGGMARAGLGPGWTCLFANDFDPKKGEAYCANWGEGAFRLADIAALTPAEIQGAADLTWGSFPCQDLSLAGAGAGLGGARSGTYFAFWRLIEGLDAEGRAPRLVAVENVAGALTARGGADFAAILEAFLRNGYRPGALLIDAAAFLPQSRPRLFVIGARDGAEPIGAPAGPFHPPALLRAVAALPEPLRAAHVWRALPPPPASNRALADLVEPGAEWLPEAETARLVSLMAPLHRARLEAAQAEGRRIVGCAFRRTRPVKGGGRAQRAELRLDGFAGCLRTPGGGSSRQFLVEIEGPHVRARLLTAREAARLMGLPDDYRLPARLNEALHLVGDGVAPPVVRWLAAHLLEPLLAAGAARAA